MYGGIPESGRTALETAETSSVSIIFYLQSPFPPALKMQLFYNRDEIGKGWVM